MNEVVGWLDGAVRTAAYPGLALLSFVEIMFPPLSSMVILPLAGFLVGRGQLGYSAVVVVTTVGSTLGATLLYAASRRLGRGAVEGLSDREWFRFADDQLARAEDWFRRYGPAAVFVGRLVPVVRSLISVPAGIARMPRTTFVAYTAGGNLGWNGGLVAAGWLLGANWREVSRIGSPAVYGVAVLLVLIVVRVAWKRWRR